MAFLDETGLQTLWSKIKNTFVASSDASSVVTGIVSSGGYVTSSYVESATVASATNAGTAAKIGTATVGTTTKPVYISAGLPVSIAVVASASAATKIGTSTVGSTDKPVYISSGVPVSMAVVASASAATTAASCTGNAATAGDASSLGGVAAASYAKDADVVKLTGVQDISDKKTFLGGLVNSRANPHIDLAKAGFSKGTTPSENTYWGFYGFDGNGVTAENRVMMLDGCVTSENVTTTRITAYKNETGSSNFAQLSVIYDNVNDTKYATAPTPSSSNDSSIKIATTEWVRTATGNTSLNAATATNAASLGGVAAGSYATSAAVSSIVSNGGYVTSSYITSASVASASNATLAATATNASSLGGVAAASYAKDADVVKLTGNQNISGTKVFSGAVINTREAPHIDLKKTGFSKGVVPADATYWAFYGFDENGTNAVNRVLLVDARVTSDNVTEARIGAYKNESGNTSYASMSVVYDTANNTTYATAPTPSDASDSSTKIATTKWVRTATGNTSLNAATATSAASAGTLTAALPISLGGTGQTTVVSARRALFGDNLSSSANYFLGITTGFSSGGYMTPEQAKIVLGLNNVDNTADSSKSVANAASLGGVAAASYTTSAAVSSIITSGGYATTSYVDSSVADKVTSAQALEAVSSGGYVTSGYVASATVASAGNATVAASCTGNAATATELAGTLSANIGFSQNNAYVSKTVNTGSINLMAAKVASEGARIALYGQGVSGSYMGAFRIYAQSGSTSVQLIGKPDGTMTWNGASIVNGSDERIKRDIGTVPDDVLDAWGAVNWTQYRYRDAVAAKGEGKARWHTGLVAQHVSSAMAAEGKDACAYGILCHEEWQDEYAEDGQRARESGDMWMVRYTEALCMEAAYQRRRADRLEKQLEELSSRVACLEQK